MRTSTWSTISATRSSKPSPPAGGIDLVKSEVSFTLGANLEKLTLLGSADIDATGNTLNNTLLGNAGANILDGGDAPCHDRRQRRRHLIVDATGTPSSKRPAAASTRSRVPSPSPSPLVSMSRTLELTGVGKINGTGNALANVITGNDADNKLIGGAGNDTLTGGKGADHLTGGTGRDTYDFDLLADAGDTIADLPRAHPATCSTSATFSTMPATAAAIRSAMAS